MEMFYVIVLSIAIILLIIILAFIGVGLKNHGGFAGSSWPPVEGTCPDYWTLDPKTNNCMIPNPDPTNPNMAPRNTGSIYLGPNYNVIDPKFSTIRSISDDKKSINFNDPYYGACNKQEWSKKWNIYWDGYSNYNGCPVPK